MPAKKLTTRDFIGRARAVHGDKYGYAFSVYKGSYVKLFIYCYKHGLFEQSPNSHLSGKGCPDCACNKKHTNELFIKRAIEIHGNRYCYSTVNYRSNRQKVSIYCNKHGVFDQTPYNHLRGVGCPACSNKKSNTETFIKKATEVHGDCYDYSTVNYLHSHQKVSICCPEHSIFKQTPSSHLTGHGCPGCANYRFNRAKAGFLYVLRSDCGRYMKIGITHKPNQRHSELSRSTPFSFKRIELIEGPGEQIVNLEKELLSCYQPAEFTEVFNGYSEWRLWDDSIRGHLVC